jgi:hypothetical protein
MPNVILKDENGEPITYNNVRTVTIPTDTGLPVSFYFGIPDATPMWTAFTNYLNSSAAASGGRLQATIYKGKNYQLVGTSTFGDFGIWLVTPYDAYQVFTGRGAWVYFIPIPGGVLISSNTNSYGSDCNGLLFYNEAEMTITRLTTLGYSYSSSTSYYYKMTNGILVWCSQACLYIDYSDYSVTTVFSQGSNSFKIVPVPEGAIILPTGSTDQPIRIFYESTKTIISSTSTTAYASTCVKIRDDYYVVANTSYGRYMHYVIPSQGIIQQMDVVNGAFGRAYEYPDFVLFCSQNNSYNYGMYLIDRETLEVSRPLTTGCSFDYRTNTSHGSVFYSSNSSSAYYGYIYFDTTTRTAVRKQITGYYWNYISETEKGIMLASTNYSGIHFFDYETEEDTLLYNSYTYWSNAYYDSVNNRLIAFSANNSCGILVYDFETGEAVRYGSQYFQYSLQCGHKIFIGSTSYTGLWVYDDRTGIAAKDETFAVTYYGIFKAVPGGCLICSYYNGTGVVYYYDEVEDTATQISTGMASGATYDDGENEIIFYSNNGSYYGGLRVYDKTTHTMTNVYSGGYSWTRIQEVDVGHIFVSNNIGTYLYNRNTHTMTSLNSSLRESSYIERRAVEGGYLFWYNYGGTSYPQGIYFYNSETKRMTSVYSRGFRWSEFEETAGGYFITMKDLPFYKKLFWDNETKTITEI